MFLNKHPVLLDNGVYGLSPGKLAVVKTYLALPPDILGDREGPYAAGLSLQKIDLDPTLRAGKNEDIERYRDLFRQVGQPWLWFERLMLDNAALLQLINHEYYEANYIVIEGVGQGVCELDFRREGKVEIAYFGLTQNSTGRGLGRLAMDLAIARGRERAPDAELYLHTCTLDSPHALPFYLNYGFKPTAREIVIHDDPRKSGYYDRGTAPQIPFL